MKPLLKKISDHCYRRFLVPRNSCGSVRTGCSLGARSSDCGGTPRGGKAGFSILFHPTTPTRSRIVRGHWGRLKPWASGTSLGMEWD